MDETDDPVDWGTDDLRDWLRRAEIDLKKCGFDSSQLCTAIQDGGITGAMVLAFSDDEIKRNQHFPSRQGQLALRALRSQLQAQSVKWWKQQNQTLADESEDVLGLSNGTDMDTSYITGAGENPRPATVTHSQNPLSDLPNSATQLKRRRTTATAIQSTGARAESSSPPKPQPKRQRIMPTIVTERLHPLPESQPLIIGVLADDESNVEPDAEADIESAATVDILAMLERKYTGLENDHIVDWDNDNEELEYTTEEDVSEPESTFEEDLNETIIDRVNYYHGKWKTRREAKLSLQAHALWSAERHNLVEQLEACAAQVEYLEARLERITDNLLQTHNTKPELIKYSAVLEQTVFQLAEYQWKVALFSKDTTPPVLSEVNVAQLKQNKPDEYSTDDDSEAEIEKSASSEDQSTALWDFDFWRAQPLTTATRLQEEGARDQLLAWTIANSDNGWRPVQAFIRKHPHEAHLWQCIRPAARCIYEHHASGYRCHCLKTSGNEARAVRDLISWYGVWRKPEMLLQGRLTTESIKEMRQERKEGDRRKLRDYYKVLRSIYISYCNQTRKASAPSRNANGGQGVKSHSDPVHHEKQSIANLDTDTTPANLVEDEHTEDGDPPKSLADIDDAAAPDVNTKENVNDAASPRSLADIDDAAAQDLNNEENMNDDASKDFNDKENMDDATSPILHNHDSLGEESSEKNKIVVRKGKKPIKKPRKINAATQYKQDKAQERYERYVRNAARLQMVSQNSDTGDVVYINPGAGNQADLIAVNRSIAGTLKPNQKEGIAFLWREVIEGEEGALLAHTMGLGKTFQSITLLSTIAETLASDRKHIVPDDLKPLKAVIVAPAGLIPNWVDEINKWATRNSNGAHHIGLVTVVDGGTDKRLRLQKLHKWSNDPGNSVLLISYSMLESLPKLPQLESERQAVHQILEKVPNIVIADEAQTFKSPTSRVNYAIHIFETPRRVALSGSPLSNNLEEYFSIVEWACGDHLGTRADFKGVYANPINAGLYSDSSQAAQRLAIKRLKALEMALSTKMHRATYESMVEMCKKTEFLIHLTPTKFQQILYDTIVRFATQDDDKMATNVLSWLDTLKLVSFHPVALHKRLLAYPRSLEQPDTPAESDKASTEAASAEASDDGIKVKHLTSERVKELLTMFKRNRHMNPNEEIRSPKLDTVLKIIRYSGDEKVLVFSHSLFTLDTIAEALKAQDTDYTRIDGGSSQMDKRQELVKKFNDGRAACKVMLISTRAGGTGLNLHGASRVIICDEGWNPTNERQAIGRAYRLGQERHVFVYRLITAGCFEELILNQSVYKLSLASRVVDRKRPERNANKNLGKYLMPMQPKPKLDNSAMLGEDPTVLGNFLLEHTIQRVQLADSFHREIDEQLNPEEEAEVREFVTRRMTRSRAKALQAADPQAAAGTL